MKHAARAQLSVLFIGGSGGEVEDATFHGPRGAEKTTVYMARKGHSLPPPTRRQSRRAHTVYLESQFKGTLLAPNGTLNFRALNGLRHEGEFYAKWT